MRRNARQAIASSIDGPCKLGSAAHSALTMPKNSPGIFAIGRPRKSLTCDSAISTAMPLVKPMITELGTKRISRPSLAAPITIRMTPAIIVQIIRFAQP